MRRFWEIRDLVQRRPEATWHLSDEELEQQLANDPYGDDGMARECVRAERLLRAWIFKEEKPRYIPGEIWEIFENTWTPRRHKLHKGEEVPSPEWPKFPMLWHYASKLMNTYWMADGLIPVYLEGSDHVALLPFRLAKQRDNLDCLDSFSDPIEGWRSRMPPAEAVGSGLQLLVPQAPADAAPLSGPSFGYALCLAATQQRDDFPSLSPFGWLATGDLSNGCLAKVAHVDKKKKMADRIGAVFLEPTPDTLGLDVIGLRTQLFPRISLFAWEEEHRARLSNNLEKYYSEIGADRYVELGGYSVQIEPTMNRDEMAPEAGRTDPTGSSVGKALEEAFADTLVLSASVSRPIDAFCRREEERYKDQQESTEEGSLLECLTRNIKQGNNVFLKGPGGTGKTTALAKFALQMARVGGSGALVPVYAKLASFRHRRLEDFLADELACGFGPVPPEVVAQLKTSGRLLLILDAADECPGCGDSGSPIQDLGRSIDGFIDLGNRAVLSSRFPNPCTNPFEIELKTMDLDWDKLLQLISKELERYNGQGASENTAEAVLERLVELQALGAVALTPFHVVCAIKALPRKQLPNWPSCAALYRDIVSSLFSREQGAKPRGKLFLSPTILEKLQDTLNHMVFDALTRGRPIVLSSVLDYLEFTEHKEAAVEIIETSSLVRKPPLGRGLILSHRIFENYFVAEHLLEKPEDISRLDKVEYDPSILQRYAELCALEGCPLQAEDQVLSYFFERFPVGTTARLKSNPWKGGPLPQTAEMKNPWIHLMVTIFLANSNDEVEKLALEICDQNLAPSDGVHDAILRLQDEEPKLAKQLLTTPCFLALGLGFGHLKERYASADGRNPFEFWDDNRQRIEPNPYDV